MSRENFEKKYSYMDLTIDRQSGQYYDEFTQTKYEGWLAGRESMRNEAAAVCNQMWEKCDSIVKRVNDGLDSDVAYYAATNACDDCEDAIRKIEP